MKPIIFYISIIKLLYMNKVLKQILGIVLLSSVLGICRFYFIQGKDFTLIKNIQFLLKERGLTINGVKKILNEKDSHSIDDAVNLGIYKSDLKSSKVIKDKVKNISKIAKELKKIKNG